MRRASRQEPRSSLRGRCQLWGLTMPTGMSPPCPLGCGCLGIRALPASLSELWQLTVSGWTMEWFVGGWHFLAHFGQPSCPVPAFPLCMVPITTILCLCVLQVPVPIHGPAGCHVTQRGAAFWVSQPLLHICWLSVLGREMGRRKGFGAGGVVPISWHPACLLVLHAAGGGVPQGTYAGAHRSPIHTPSLFRFKYVIGIGVGAGAYVLAKFAVSLGLGWAGPASSVPAVSSGHG